MCGIDHFGFGTCYLLLIYGFFYKREWVKPLGMIYGSMIVYSTIVYFAFEFFFERARANLLWVVIINIPYTLVPLLLMLRVWLFTSTGDLRGKVFYKQ